MTSYGCGTKAHLFRIKIPANFVLAHCFMSQDLTDYHQELSSCDAQHVHAYWKRNDVPKFLSI